LLQYSNPTFSKPDGKRWAQAMAKVPFVVSFSPILDESALGADLLLPDRSFLERWDVVGPARGSGTFSLRQPVVAPLGNAMQTGDVVLRLAAALGDSVAKAFPWKDCREAVLARFAACSGNDGGAFGELNAKGVWKVGGDGGGGAAGLLDVTPASAENAPATAGDAVQFPFVLCPFRGRGCAEGGARQFPWLVELPGSGDDSWRGHVEIAPDDARQLGIADGDWVAVTSPVARVELRARIHAQLRPGVLGLPLGGWGRVLGDSDGTPARLLAGLADPATGQWLAWGTRAKVGKVS
jgi:anaerobic selenocysteine-containing dehydrogenase